VNPLLKGSDMARPLLKKNEKGVLTRPPGIEAKTDIALAQDWATLSRRARETNPLSPDFLPSECLVHLIRHAIRRSEDRTARVLMPQLLKRAEANLTQRNQSRAVPWKAAAFPICSHNRNSLRLSSEVIRRGVPCLSLR
jgi:hypothetical protein